MEKTPFVQIKARLAGALWLAVIVTNMIAYMIATRLVSENDATATARNIIANETLYRAGFAFELLSGLCYIGVTVLMYELVKPVNKTLAVVSAFFGGCGVAIGGGMLLARMGPIVLLHSDRVSAALPSAQLEVIALSAFKLYVVGFIISLAFFGIQCFFLGYLIARSTFLPRWIGLLLAAGGSIYVLTSFSNVVVPSVGARMIPLFSIAALLGEGSLSVWLVTKGVKSYRMGREEVLVRTQ